MRLTQQPVSTGHRGGFGAGADAELAEDVRDVHADRLLTDVELAGELPVRPALGQQLQHLGFPRGQCATAEPWAVSAAELVEQGFGAQLASCLSSQRDLL